METQLGRCLNRKPDYPGRARLAAFLLAISFSFTPCRRPCHNVQTLSTFLLQVLYAFCLFLFTFLSRARKKHLKCSLELLKFISMFSFPFFYASIFRWDDWCDRNVCMGGVFLSWASNDPGRSAVATLGSSISVRIRIPENGNFNP